MLLDFKPPEMLYLFDLSFKSNNKPVTFASLKSPFLVTYVLIKVTDEILSKSFDFTVDAYEPIKAYNNWNVKLVVHARSNDNFNNLKPIIKNVIDNINLNYDRNRLRNII